MRLSLESDTDGPFSLADGSLVAMCVSFRFVRSSLSFLREQVFTFDIVNQSKSTKKVTIYMRVAVPTCRCERSGN